MKSSRGMTGERVMAATEGNRNPRSKRDVGVAMPEKSFCSNDRTGVMACQAAKEKQTLVP
jgi:hypothetical protein